MNLENIINSDIQILENLETDSTSVKMSDSEYFQPKKMNKKNQPPVRAKIDQLIEINDDGQTIDEEMSESIIFTNNDDEINFQNNMATDSTSITDSSILQSQDNDSKPFYFDNDTDSTSLESSEIFREKTIKISKTKPHRQKSLRTIIDSKMSNNPKYRIQNDFLFTRPENNLRTKENRKDRINSDFTYHSFQSGRSNYRGMYDPFHLRPPTIKQSQKFEPIPMDQPQTTKKEINFEMNSAGSKSSRNSKTSRRQKTDSNTPTILYSTSDLPTPISGFIVTDTNPSPHQITLERSDDEIYNAMIRLIELGEIPPVEKRKQVIYMLKREGVNAMVNEEYDKAQKMEEAQFYLRDYLQADLNQKKTEFSQNAIETKIRDAQYELKTESDEWDELLRAYKERQSNERGKLLQRHKEEQEKFSEKWTQHSTLIPFNKPSSQLIQLRKMQKNLALTKNFAEAKAIKLRAEELQRQETIEAEKKIKQAIWTSYQTLKEKQKRELDCFDEHTRKNSDFIVLKKQELIEPIQKLIKSLKTGYPCFYVTDDNDENRKRVASASPSSAASVSSHSKTLPKQKNPIQATPRTRQALTDFRREGEPSKLNINSNVIKEYVNAKRTSSSCKVSRIPK